MFGSLICRQTCKLKRYQVALFLIWVSIHFNRHLELFQNVADVKQWLSLVHSSRFIRPNVFTFALNGYTFKPLITPKHYWFAYSITSIVQ